MTIFRGSHGNVPDLSSLSMVTSVTISNFRGFEQFEVSDLALINIIVGDNAVGKTALLEAMFLALSGNPDRGLLLKQFRGMDFTFMNNSGESLFEGLYADLFHDTKSLRPIKVVLRGNGFENRELNISHLSGDVLIPARDLSQARNRRERRAPKSQKGRLQTLDLGQSITAPILMAWIDEQKRTFEGKVLLTPAGLQFQGTGERIPNSFFFSAQNPVPAAESATHYSALKKNRDADRFRSVFFDIFEEITDISVDAIGNLSMLLADVPWAKQLLPLPAFSGGTNRVSAILLALAHRAEGVVLVDEVESGIYHARQARLAKGLIRMSREYKSQLIMTTHSNEWLESFIEAGGESNSDIAFWRMERNREKVPTIRKFSLDEFASGMSAGEMR